MAGVSRREFIKLSGVVAGSSVLVACGNEGSAPVGPAIHPENYVPAQQQANVEPLGGKTLAETLGKTYQNMSMELMTVTEDGMLAYTLDTLPQTLSGSSELIREWMGLSILDALYRNYLPAELADYSSQRVPVGGDATREQLENGALMNKPGGDVDSVACHAEEGTIKDNAHGPKAWAMVGAALGIGAGAAILQAKISEVGIKTMSMATVDGGMINIPTLSMTVEMAEANAQAYLNSIGSSLKEVGAVVENGKVYARAWLPQYAPAVVRNALPTIYILGQATLERFGQLASANLKETFGVTSPERRFARKIVEKLINDLLNHPRTKERCTKKPGDKGALDDLNRFSLDDLFGSQVGKAEKCDVYQKPDGSIIVTADTTVGRFGLFID